MRSVREGMGGSTDHGKPAQGYPQVRPWCPVDPLCPKALVPCPQALDNRLTLQASLFLGERTNERCSGFATLRLQRPRRPPHHEKGWAQCLPPARPCATQGRGTFGPGSGARVGVLPVSALPRGWPLSRPFPQAIFECSHPAAAPNPTPTPPWQQAVAAHTKPCVQGGQGAGRSRGHTLGPRSSSSLLPLSLLLFACSKRSKGTES